MRWGPHTALDTNNTFKFKHTHVLFVQGQHGTRPIYSTNEDQRRAVIEVFLNSTWWGWGWDYDHTASNTNNNTYQIQAHSQQRMQTYVLFVHPGSTQRLVAYLDSKIGERLQYHQILHRTAIIPSNLSTHAAMAASSYKRTRCLFSVNMIPITCIQPTKINAEQPSPL